MTVTALAELPLAETVVLVIEGKYEELTATCKTGRKHQHHTGRNDFYKDDIRESGRELRQLP